MVFRYTHTHTLTSLLARTHAHNKNGKMAYFDTFVRLVCAHLMTFLD